MLSPEVQKVTAKSMLSYKMGGPHRREWALGLCCASEVWQMLSGRGQAHPCALSFLHTANMLTNSLCQMTSCPWRVLPPMTLWTPQR